MKVITLQQFGEQRFLDELKIFEQENHTGDVRNRDWFSRIPEIYKTHFIEWFFLVDIEEYIPLTNMHSTIKPDILIAFATIQEFYPGCFRLLTRTYYNPRYRRSHLYYDKDAKTPAMHLVKAQEKYLSNYKTVFISMQDLKRRPALDRVRRKLGGNWKMNPNMIQTCNENSSNCWQSAIYLGEPIELPSISISDWDLMSKK